MRYQLLIHQMIFHCIMKDGTSYTVLYFFFKQENLFQKESVPKKLLFLTKGLINGFNYNEVNVHQESLIATEVIDSNATKRTKIKKKTKN